MASPLLLLPSRIVFGLVLGFTLGCASTPATTVTPGIPSTRVDTAVVAQPQQPGAAALPAFTYRDGTHSYDVEQRTVIAVGSEAGAMIEDTVVTTGSLTYSIRMASDTVIVTGVMDSLSVASSRDSVTPPRRLAAPVSIDIRPGLPAPVLPIDTTVPPVCDSMEDAARAIARDAHIRIPAGAQRGQRWTDSTSVAVCRGGIPMTATTVSAFEVQDVRTRGDSVIGQVIRRSTLTLAGSGMQGVRRIAVSGTGTSETLFSYELRAGAFIESTGQSVLELRFETDQQTDRVSQRSSSRVRRRAP